MTGQETRQPFSSTRPSFSPYFTIGEPIGSSISGSQAGFVDPEPSAPPFDAFFYEPPREEEVFPSVFQKARRELLACCRKICSAGVALASLACCLVSMLLLAGASWIYFYGENLPPDFGDGIYWMLVSVSAAAVLLLIIFTSASLLLFAFFCLFSFFERLFSPCWRGGSSGSSDFSELVRS